MAETSNASVIALLFETTQKLKVQLQENKTKTDAILKQALLQHPQKANDHKNNEKYQAEVAALTKEREDLMRFLAEYRETIELITSKHVKKMQLLQQHHQQKYAKLQVELREQQQTVATVRAENARLKQELGKTVTVMKQALEEEHNEDLMSNEYIAALEHENSTLRNLLDIKPL